MTSEHKFILPSSQHASKMSIQGPFKILINNQAVAPVSDNGEDQIQANLGSEPAIFTLIDGRLECNGWYLSRGLIEDRSLLPKRVFWFRKGSPNEEMIHSVSTELNEGSYKLWISGAPLMSADNMLFADLMQGDLGSVEVTMV